MPMILYHDTKTTGLPEKGAFDAPNQPWIVQYAGALECPNTPGSFGRHSAVIMQKPSGWTIGEKAASIHMITDDVADRFGLRPAAFYAVIGSMTKAADIVVAHNQQFDAGMVRRDFARSYQKGHVDDPLAGKTLFCTMTAATKIVGLPPTERMLMAGINRPKPPSLSECIAHFWPGTSMAGAHDAGFDMIWMRRLFWKLVALGAGPDGVSPIDPAAYEPA